MDPDVFMQIALLDKAFITVRTTKLPFSCNGKKVKYEQPNKKNLNYLEFPFLRVEMHQKSKHYGLSQEDVVRTAYVFQAFLDIFLALGVSRFVGNLRFSEILP